MAGFATFLKNEGQMFGTNLAIKTIFVTAPMLAFAQITSTPGVDLPWISQIERTGLLGALLLAVGFLWKSRESDNAVFRAKVAEKDQQILTMTEHVTASLTMQVETNRELRKILEESARAKDNLAQAIELMTSTLTKRPCLLEEEGQKKVGRR
jgi:hypothetical protein